MIITTNLKLVELKNPPDLAHARIYDRILERCAPILSAGKTSGKRTPVTPERRQRSLYPEIETINQRCGQNPCPWRQGVRERSICPYV